MFPVGACIIIPILVVAVAIATPSNRIADDLETLRQRARETFAWPSAASIPTTVATAKSLATTLNSTCYWPDINYFDQSRANWATFSHLSRTVTMVQAVTVPGSPVFEDPSLSTAAHCALGVWLERGFKNPNWWYAWIGENLDLEQIFLMFGSNRTSAAEQALLIQYSFNSSWWINDYAGGANLVDMLQVEAMRGIASNNLTAINQAFDTMWQNVMQGNVTDNWQGVVSDMSYHFHGQQLLNCAYGSVWLSSILDWWVIAADTQWAMPPTRTAIVAEYIADGNAHMTFNGGCDWASVGRGIDRPGLDFSWGVNPLVLTQLAASPSASNWSSDLLAFAARISHTPGAPALIGNKHFHTIDYHAHHRATWGASVKMHGNNSLWTVVPNECDNSENLLGEHTGDGVLNIFTSTGAGEVGGLASAYESIFPLLDWSALGGITVEHDTPLEACSQATGDEWLVNNTKFVGGVSDALFGAAFMDTATHHTTTQRSWFFLDDAVVALATNLTTNNRGDSEVWTTLTSRLLPATGEGSVVSVAFHNGTTVAALPDGEYTFDGATVNWILGGNLGMLPAVSAQFSAKVGVRIGTVKGDWSTIGAFSGSVTGRLLTVYLNHGRDLPPANATSAAAGYVYVLVPNVTLVAMPAAAAALGGAAVSSTTLLVHGVGQPSANLLTAVFWAPNGGTCSGNTTTGLLVLSTNLSGAVMARINPASGELTVTVSHPTQLGSLIHVAVNRPALVGPACAPAPGENATIFSIRLPTDPNFMGKSVSATCIGAAST